MRLSMSIHLFQKSLSTSVDLAAHEIQGWGEQGPEEQEGAQREEGEGQDKPEEGAEDSRLRRLDGHLHGGQKHRQGFVHEARRGLGPSRIWLLCCRGG